MRKKLTQQAYECRTMQKLHESASGTGRGVLMKVNPREYIYKSLFAQRQQANK